jgi:hypothetical protein
MKHQKSLARRWFIGVVAGFVCAGPILTAASLSRWVDTHFPQRTLLSFLCWLMVLVAVVAWPAYLPEMLQEILRSDAGLGGSGKENVSSDDEA